MPSPFPGMDPFIEDQEWEDFHSTFNTVMREALAPDVEPRYIVRVERRIYVEHGLEAEDQVRWADVSLEEIREWVKRADRARRQAARSAAMTARQRLENLLKTLDEATAVISIWIDRYNNERPHSQLG